MATGSAMALKMILRGFGVDTDAMEKKINEASALFQEFDLNELRAALQLVLDYKTHQAQNELRLKAIMAKLEIADPVDILNLLQQKENPNE